MHKDDVLDALIDVDDVALAGVHDVGVRQVRQDAFFAHSLREGKTNKQTNINRCHILKCDLAAEPCELLPIEAHPRIPEHNKAEHTEQTLGYLNTQKLLRFSRRSSSGEKQQTIFEERTQYYK